MYGLIIMLIMTALYIADIELRLVGTPKLRKNQKKPSRKETHVIRHHDVPLTLIDATTIHPARYNRTIYRLTHERVKDVTRYHVTYQLKNVRFSSKIMVDLPV